MLPQFDRVIVPPYVYFLAGMAAMFVLLLMLALKFKGDDETPVKARKWNGLKDLKYDYSFDFKVLPGLSLADVAAHTFTCAGNQIAKDEGFKASPATQGCIYTVRVRGSAFFVARPLEDDKPEGS